MCNLFVFVCCCLFQQGIAKFTKSRWTFSLHSSRSIFTTGTNVFFDLHPSMILGFNTSQHLVHTLCINTDNNKKTTHTHTYIYIYTWHSSTPHTYLQKKGRKYILAKKKEFSNSRSINWLFNLMTQPTNAINACYFVGWYVWQMCCFWRSFFMTSWFAISCENDMGLVAGFRWMSCFTVFIGI